MQEENRLFEALLDVIPFAAYAVDVDTYEVVYANKQMSQNMYAPKETFCWKRLYGQESACSWCTIPNLKQRKRVYSNDKLITSFFDEGSDKWFQSYDELVKWPDGRTVKYSITVDITEQKEIQASFIKTNTKLAIQTKKLKQANAMLEHLAKTDYLTGINNRGEFFAQLNKLFETKLPFKETMYAMMLDLDNFKKLNDVYGHAYGDRALQQFTLCVNKHLGQNDLFGRLGGEEFAVIAIEKSFEAAQKKCEAIQKDVAALRLNKSDDSGFTVSIGLVEKAPDDTPDSLLDKADKELYGAKKAGKNRIKTRVNDARK
jgi:diguanylate cyclase (GGDEF)-like protein